MLIEDWTKLKIPSEMKPFLPLTYLHKIESKRTGEIKNLHIII